MTTSEGLALAHTNKMDALSPSTQRRESSWESTAQENRNDENMPLTMMWRKDNRNKSTAQK